VVIELTQRRRGYLDPKWQALADADRNFFGEPDFTYRGGCTLLIDVATNKIRLCIAKNILSDNRLNRQRRYLAGEATPSLRVTYFGVPRRGSAREPFAMLHRGS
jgi:hypothetical protein